MMMDQILIATFVGAVTLIIVVVVYFLSSRDISRNRNQTEREIAHTKAETETLVAKLGHDGKLQEISSNERLGLAQLNQVENCKKFEVGMHSNELEIKKLVLTSDLRRTEMMESAKTVRTELSTKNNSELKQMDIAYKTYETDVRKEMWRSQLLSNERMHKSTIDLQGQELDGRIKMAELSSATTKFLSDNAFKTEAMLEKGQNSRFRLGCQTQLEINQDNNSTSRYKFDSIKSVEEKRIKSTENCFKSQMCFNRFEQQERTKRSKIEADGRTKVAEIEAHNNPFGNILGNVMNLGLAAASPARIPALAALTGSTLLGNPGGLNSRQSRPIIEEVE